eukprot:10206579-Ditylum_brightwellii.AAC.1
MDMNLKICHKIRLTANEVSWDHFILEDDSNITVPFCWDGGLESLKTTSNDFQAQEEHQQFNNYILQKQHS